jgi:hypothetical protein
MNTFQEVCTTRALTSVQLYVDRILVISVDTHAVKSLTKKLIYAFDSGGCHGVGDNSFGDVSAYAY